MDLSPPPTSLSDLDDVAEGSTAATSVSVCDGRGNTFTVDQERFTANAERVRTRLLPGVEVWQVAKGNGYGLGVELAVRLGHRAGMRSFCVGTPAEALRVRRVAPGCSVLLFTACPPDITAELAAQQVIVTVNSLEAYQALVDSGSPSRFFLELDCGFGRYGLSQDDLRTLRARYCERQPVKCVGAYTHFGMATERLLQSGTALFDLMVEEFTRGLTRPIATMVASTETILRAPHLGYSAVDPGRLLYGIAGPDQDSWGIVPVLQSVTSQLVQVSAVGHEREVQIGYGGPVRFGPGARLAAFPLGWLDGLSAAPPFGEVLVGGQRCPVIARTLQHSIVDISSTADAKAGTLVTLVGEDDGSELTLESAASAQDVSPLQLHMKLLGAIAATGDFPRHAAR